MFSLALVFFGFLVVYSASQLEIENKCNETIWPAIHGVNPQAIDGQRFVKFNELPSSGLLTNQIWRTDVPKDHNVSGRVWPRTGCQKNGENLHCSTGDCAGYFTCLNATASNTSLVEYNIENAKIIYDISLGKLNMLSANST